MSIEIVRKKDLASKPTGRHKTAGGDSGASKKKMELPKGAREEAQKTTQANQMMLVLSGRNMKRSWVRLKDMRRR
jgi:hypothetical protein